MQAFGLLDYQAVAGCYSGLGHHIYRDCCEDLCFPIKDLPDKISILIAKKTYINENKLKLRKNAHDHYRRTDHTNAYLVK